MTEKNITDKNILAQLEKFKKSESSKATQYYISQNYSIDEFINHKKFGFGLVTETVGKDKIRVFFPDKKRILLQNFKKE